MLVVNSYSALQLGSMHRSAAASAAIEALVVCLPQKVSDKDRPDEAFTTDRAVRAGRANAASGRIMVTVPGDHFGPIPPEADPRGQVCIALVVCEPGLSVAKLSWAPFVQHLKQKLLPLLCTPVRSSKMQAKTHCL